MFRILCNRLVTGDCHMTLSLAGNWPKINNDFVISGLFFIEWGTTPSYTGQVTVRMARSGPGNEARKTLNEQLPQYAPEIIGFFRHIGLEVDQCELPEETFLPGIAVTKGRLRIDPAKLKYPGDLLHEAGHLAVIPPEERRQAGDDFAGSGGNEMAAIAWSYAACMYLDLPLEMLFHETGYKGDAHWLAETYSRAVTLVCRCSFGGGWQRKPASTLIR